MKTFEVEPEPHFTNEDLQECLMELTDEELETLFQGCIEEQRQRGLRKIYGNI